MRALVRRVKSAQVVIEGKQPVRSVKVYWCFGITENDAEEQADYLAQKIVKLRILMMIKIN